MTLRKSWLVAAESAPEGANALDGRLAHAGSYVRDSDGLVRAGVLGYRKNIVTARPDMALDIGDFEAVLTRGISYGVTPIANIGVLGVELPESPSSGSRWVRVYAAQHDNVDAADADNEPVLAYVAGNPSASPAVPALPVGALPFARILQPANVLGTQDCTVIEEFPMTAAVGGVVYFRNQAEQEAFECPDGQRAWRIDLQDDDVRQRGSWGDTGTVAFNANYRNGYPGMTIRRKGKSVRIRGQFANKVIVNVAPNSQYGFADIAAEFRPGSYVFAPCAINASTGQYGGQVIIFPNGGMYFSLNGTATIPIGQLQIAFDIEYDVA
jgi:hypothetical protein